MSDHNTIMFSALCIDKNKRISDTMKATREKRKTQALFVVKTKIVEKHLSTKQKEALKAIFLEAKWFKNSMVAFTNSRTIDDFDTKNTMVTVRMGKDSNTYEDRVLNYLSSSTRQKMRDVFKSNIKSLASNKKNGRKVGKIDYVKEINSVPLKQYGRDYKIVSSHHINLPKIGKVRVRGLEQISQGADIANAELVCKPDGYYIHINVYIPLVFNPDIMTREDVGIDFGVKKSLTTSHGEVFDVFIPESPRLKRLQRALSRAEKQSGNWFKILKQVKCEYQKMENHKEEAANQIVHYLLTRYRFVYIQDENLTGWKSSFGKKVQHSILGRVKAKLISHPRVIVLKRHVPTTQYCPECGALNKHSLDKRVYSCPCGYFQDRDIHAAENMVIMSNLSHGFIKKGVVEDKVSVERADIKRLPES